MSESTKILKRSDILECYKCGNKDFRINRVQWEKLGVDDVLIWCPKCRRGIKRKELCRMCEMVNL